VSSELENKRSSSPIETISMYIRFRAKLNSQYPLTFKSELRYNCKSNEFELIETKYDGIK